MEDMIYKQKQWKPLKSNIIIKIEKFQKKNTKHGVCDIIYVVRSEYNETKSTKKLL